MPSSPFPCRPTESGDLEFRMTSLTRRTLIAQGAAATLAAPALAQPRGGSWTYEQYAAAMQASDRRVAMNKATFDGVMRRREQALRIVETYLRGKFQEPDAHTLRA